MKFVFIFIDGVGVGPSRTETNPIAQLGSSLFPMDLRLLETAELPFDGIAKAIDANLGVPGLPQSATGQSTLFTGVNTPKMLGYHLFAFPNKEIRSLLYRQNILKDLRTMGKDAVFINAYPGAEENFIEKKV
ncbi:MAG: metalloenzyme, partial [Spirochaetia bacterium]|nr:metalloenzyme [Spirochaetia bacterium]